MNTNNRMEDPTRMEWLGRKEEGRRNIGRRSGREGDRLGKNRRGEGGTEEEEQKSIV